MGLALASSGYTLGKLIQNPILKASNDGIIYVVLTILDREKDVRKLFRAEKFRLKVCI